MKITFFLILAVVSIVLPISYAGAEEIRIACIIPETPGLNIPLINERTYQETRVKEKEASIAIQKESTELRLVQGSLKNCTIQTVYVK